MSSRPGAVDMLQLMKFHCTQHQEEALNVLKVMFRKGPDEEFLLLLLVIVIFMRLVLFLMAVQEMP